MTGTQNIGGISQPIIGQRRIEHDARLKDGEVNLIGGILEDSETQSLSGYPWLAKLPVLKYLFGQENKDRRENEIVFSITPHIIRGQEVNDRRIKTGRCWEWTLGGCASQWSKRERGPECGTNGIDRGAPVGPQSFDPGCAGESEQPAKPLPSSAMVQPPPSLRPSPSQPRPAPVPTQASTPPSPSQAPTDPCPYGQHQVQQQNGIAICAFD